MYEKKLRSIIKLILEEESGESKINQEPDDPDALFQNLLNKHYKKSNISTNIYDVDDLDATAKAAQTAIFCTNYEDQCEEKNGICERWNCSRMKMLPFCTHHSKILS